MGIVWSQRYSGGSTVISHGRGRVKMANNGDLLYTATLVDGADWRSIGEIRRISNSRYETTDGHQFKTLRLAKAYIETTWAF